MPIKTKLKRKVVMLTKNYIVKQDGKFFYGIYKRQHGELIPEAGTIPLYVESTSHAAIRRVHSLAKR